MYPLPVGGTLRPAHHCEQSGSQFASNRAYRRQPHHISTVRAWRQRDGSALLKTMPTAASMMSSSGTFPYISAGHATTPVSMETAASSAAPEKTSPSISYI